MPEPTVVAATREFKAGLLAREERQVREMTRRWLQIERSLQDKIDLLTEEISRLRNAGESINQGKILQMWRYQELIVQVRAEVTRYEQWAAQRISREQSAHAEMGIEQATEQLRLQIVGSFNVLPVEAVRVMTGMAADGAPLFELMKARALWPEAVDGLTRALVNAVAQGWNPRKTALKMRDGLTDGLQKALVIARSEQLRAYRWLWRLSIARAA